MNRHITQDDAIAFAEMVCDEIGERTGRGFTESEETQLAILIYGWCQHQGVPTEDGIVPHDEGVRRLRQIKEKVRGV